MDDALRVQAVKLRNMKSGEAAAWLMEAHLLEIRRHLGNGDIQWQVSFHGSSEGAEAGMESIGINTNEVRFVPLTEPAQWACP